MKERVNSILILFLFSFSFQPAQLMAEINGPCAIESINIEFLECNTDGTYNVELYYTIVNPIGDTLSLFINSEHHGDYEIGGSLTISNIEPSDVFDTDLFFLCMKEDEDCFIDQNFAHPDCLCDGPCAIEDIQVLVLECDEDENTYTAQVFYTINNPGHDVVHVTINYEYFGSYPIGENIIIEGITPRPNSDYDIIQICAAEECCGEFEYMQEDCSDSNDPCNIFNIEIVNFICSNNGVGFAAIWLEYDAINAPDSIIYVTLNGEEIGGWTVGNTISFDVSTDAQFLDISLFFDNTDCSESLEIANLCEDNDCGWQDIQLVGVECLENEYFALVEYFILNPPFDEVYLSVNGASEGSFSVNQPIAFEGLTTPEIEIYLYFYSEETDTICGIAQTFDNPCFECDFGCLTGQLEYSYTCVDDGNGQNGYSLIIEPELECGTDSLDLLITINNQISLTYNSSENWIFDFIPMNPNSDFFSVSVCYEDNPDCCFDYEFLQPPCENNLPCAIDSAMVYLNCVNDNLYYLEGFALITNPTGDFVDVFLDSTYVGLFEITNNNVVEIFTGDTQIFTLEPNSLYDITICVNDNPDCCSICLYSELNCCSVFPWDQPECFGDDDDPVEQLYSIQINDSEIVIETKEISQIGLLDTSGRKVRSHGSAAHQHRINTTGLTTGIYLVNVIEPTRIVTKKVFVSN